MAIRVTSLRLIDKVARADKHILAEFEADVGPCTVRRCKLILNPKTAWLGFLPPSTGPGHDEFAVLFHGSCSEMVAQAVQVYQAMGGTMFDPVAAEAEG